jgi:hypothetical protein
MNSLLKFAKYGAGGIFALLSFWLTAGNLAATQMKRKPDAQLAAFIADSLAKRPDYNESALRLRELGIGMGLDVASGVDEETEQQITQELRAKNPNYAEQSQAFEAIQEELDQYIQSQLNNPQDGFTAIPETLATFLAQHQTQIREIQNHLATQPAPTWYLPESVITVFESRDMGLIASVALPSFLNQVQLNRVLLLQLIQDNQAGLAAEVNRGAQASWKLAGSSTTGLTLIAELVQVINENLTAGILRKVDQVPLALPENWVSDPTEAGILKSLEYEFLGFQYAGMSGLRLSDLTVFSQVSGADHSPVRYAGVPEQLFWPADLFFRPYFIFSAINSLEYSIANLNAFRVNPPNICDPNFQVETLETLGGGQIGWWNILGQIATPAFLTQPLKGLQRGLSLELTEQVLKAKASAAQEGAWPQTLPNLKSQICPGTNWEYTVAADGSLTLELGSYSPWLAERLTPDPEGRSNYPPLVFYSQ